MVYDDVAVDFGISAGEIAKDMGKLVEIYTPDICRCSRLWVGGGKLLVEN